MLRKSTFAAASSLLAISISLSIGCSDSKTDLKGDSQNTNHLNQPNQAQDETKAALQSWEAFTATIKSNCERFIEQSFSIDNTTVVSKTTMALVSNDIKKSDSLKSPYEGTVIIQIYSQYLGSESTSHQYDLKFQLQNGQWVFSSGEGKRLTGGKKEDLGKSFAIPVGFGRNTYLKTVVPQPN